MSTTPSTLGAPGPDSRTWVVPPQTPAITTTALEKRYGKTVALAPTSLTIPRGSIFALLGHNGAGKTTLLKLLVNILRPTAGSATVLSRPSTAIAGDDFLTIGYVSENQDLPGWMTVRAFLDYQRGFYPQWNDAALLERFDLPLNRKLKHLSRGQRMKAALASVLAFSPQLILLDEPFSGLDPLVRDELIEALLDAVASRTTPEPSAPRPDPGTWEAQPPAPAAPPTILLSSHDLAEIESFCTHVAFLDHGNLLFAEELPQLTTRFRDVTVTLPEMGALGPDFRTRDDSPQASALPPTWLSPQTSAHTLRFIHTAADTEPIESQVRALYPGATVIDQQPMTLREIFLAIAGADRNEGSR